MGQQIKLTSFSLLVSLKNFKNTSTSFGCTTSDATLFRTNGEDSIVYSYSRTKNTFLQIFSDTKFTNHNFFSLKQSLQLFLMKKKVQSKCIDVKNPKTLHKLTQFDCNHWKPNPTLFTSERSVYNWNGRVIFNTNFRSYLVAFWTSIEVTSYLSQVTCKLHNTWHPLSLSLISQKETHFLWPTNAIELLENLQKMNKKSVSSAKMHHRFQRQQNAS